MPALLRMAGESAVDRDAVQKMSKTVEEALATAEAASYRIDALLGPEAEPEAGSQTLEPDEPGIEANEPPTERIEPGEPAIEPPAVSADDSDSQR
jgi:hypothetical protein